MENKILLREFNEQVELLLEDDGGGDGGMGSVSGGWGTGIGASMGMGKITTDDKLYKTFIKPFVNVAKTAGSAGKAMVQHTRTIVMTIAKTILQTLIPTYKANFEKTFENHNKVLSQINKEYVPVYKDIIDSMKNNEDFMVSAFMYDPSSFFNTSIQNPQTFVTLWGGAKAPQLFGNLLSSLSGGAVDPYIEKLKKSISPSISTKKKPVKYDGKKVNDFFSTFASNESVHAGEKILLEINKKQFVQVIKYLTNPQLIKKALSSDVSQGMQRAVQDTTDKTLQQIVSIVERTMKITSLDAIQGITGERIQGIEDLKKLTPEERQQVEDSILTGFKNSVKQLYTDNISSMLKKLLDAHVPSTNGMVRAYQETLNKIKTA